MKRGDLVRIDGQMINFWMYKIETLGIYLKDIPQNHKHYSPSFPSCEILTSRGIKQIGLERIKPI
jgi:hypothetical protein